jgi:acetyl-CoA acetyltransferase
MLTKAYIPYGGYYSSPFARWQGSFANDNAIVLGAETAKRWLSEKNWDPGMLDYLYLGTTVGQHYLFYGSTWAAHLMGAGHMPGVTLMQACSTSTTCIFQASIGVETGTFENPFCLMTDRCSNGPHTVWPNIKGPGGQVESENWVMDHFSYDPTAKGAMIQTAENVAAEAGVTREECDRVALRRAEQYTDALADDQAFQKRYMFPVEVKVSKKKTITVSADEGVFPTTEEGLSNLRSVIPGGVHTFGSQTHPADGNVGILVTTRDQAKKLSTDSNIEIQVVSYGFHRTDKGFMAKAVVPASRMALERAGITIDDVKTIKTHNPFASNDLYMAKEFNIDVMEMNNYGSPMVFGHPQGPTAGRCIIEGIEELAASGGGYLLFGGCAAGDTAGAMVLKIG